VKAESGYRTSFATRLAFVVLVVSIASILVTVVISTVIINSTGDDLISERVRTRSSTLVVELDQYFDDAAKKLGTLAVFSSTAEAIDQFSAAFEELDATDPDLVDTKTTNVAAYYVDEFIPVLAEVRGQLVDPDTLVPQSSPASIYLQSVYIAESPVDGADRRFVTDPGDGSGWTDVHTRFHPGTREWVDLVGFKDLFLVDAETEVIVYSTNKDISFGTDIVSGPQSGGPLAGLLRAVLSTGEPGAVRFADFAPYPPLLDSPAGFLAAPVFDGDRLVGAAAVSINLGDVTEILTTAWRQGRFGETGESYLVGSDKTMRSDSRLFLEDPTSYLTQVTELGSTTDADLRRMELLGTTIVFQPVDNDSVRAGLDGESGVSEVTSYLGNEVFSVHTPIASDLVGWVLISEQEVGEAEEPFGNYIQAVLTVTVVFVVALTFLAVSWASSFVAPIRRMGAALRTTLADESATSVPVTGVSEFRALAIHLNAMSESLAIRREAVLRALRGKTGVLRTLLPASALAQVRVDDRRFVETAPQASVVVVNMRGIDDLFPTGDIDGYRELFGRLIERADVLAEVNGLERVKVAGESYFAASGISTPHLDHAPRAVRFAAECVRALHVLAEDSGIQLDVAAGVATGRVTAGLVGDSRLVFDLWGDAVDDAYRLGYAAGSNRVYLSEATRSRLPGSFTLEEVFLRTGDVAWSLDALDMGSDVTT
jgi:class 3 adenylate cyclase